MAEHPGLLSQEYLRSRTESTTKHWTYVGKAIFYDNGGKRAQLPFPLTKLASLPKFECESADTPAMARHAVAPSSNKTPPLSEANVGCKQPQMVHIE